MAPCVPNFGKVRTGFKRGWAGKNRTWIQSTKPGYRDPKLLHLCNPSDSVEFGGNDKRELSMSLTLAMLLAGQTVPQPKPEPVPTPESAAAQDASAAQGAPAPAGAGEE